MNEPTSFVTLCRVAARNVCKTNTDAQSAEQTAGRILERAATEIERLRKLTNKQNYAYGKLKERLKK